VDIPRISVVTSAYNSEPYIAKAIESILSQTFEDFEFILVDDCSKDRTWEIILSYASQDPRIVAMRNEKNLGVVGGLNRGLEAARGEFIARQDADDISLPERFARQVDFLDNNPEYGLVGSRVTFIDSQDRPTDVPNPFQATENDEIQQKLLVNNCLCGPALMIRRSSLVSAGSWFGEGLDASEDYDLCLRLAEVTKLASIVESLYLYRKHPQAASITQEYRQVVHKAVALERAVHRRWGERAGQEYYSVIAQDYLWAAILAYAQGNWDGAHQALERSRNVYPPIIEQIELYERLIRYRMPDAVDPAVAYIQKLFEEFLPKTHQFARLKSRLIASIFMKEVFKGVEKGERPQDLTYLWAGISHNPSWLFNKGVIAILIRYFFSKG